MEISMFLKQFTLTLLPVVIFIGYPIYMHVGVWGRGAESHLWNPYIFTGMPSYAISTGYVWWNLIGVAFSTARDILLYSPYWTVLFAGSIFFFFLKENKLRYIIMIFAELVVLYYAHWELGVRIGVI